MFLSAAALILALWQSEPQTIGNDTQSSHWASLGYARTNGRTGPGEDYTIRWVYHRKYLPVQVLRRASEWSQIKDVDGDVVWIHNAQLRTRKMAFVIGEAPALLMGARRKRRKSIARLAPGVLVRIESCQIEECQIRVRDKTGWIAKSALWGPVDTTPNPN
jgi:SH3-like domain-containing protein